MLTRPILLLFALFAIQTSHAQNFPDGLKWRCVGPHRGGRTVGACGVPQQPNTFYIGVNNGGVWKTTDAGRVWKPIFDDQPTGSIGDVAVAPSDPKIVYVASGEGLQRPDLSVGNGLYKSTDAGKTWKLTGLDKGLQIGGLAIDPKNPDRLFAAVLGHPYGPNKERGLYRSNDGGKTWKSVLYKDENTGAIQVAIDPVNPLVVYCDLWAARMAPWENGQFWGETSGLYKSIDGGDHWDKLEGGLPTVAEGLSRVGFCICPNKTSRLYAVVSVKKGDKDGIYRSDDAGKTWKRTANDPRLASRGDDFAEIKADPKNSDIVYDVNVVTWKSTDGGQTWKALKGAPGGDDYHRLWINPTNPETMLLAGDQGAVVTLNGGDTWSSWYNQPTAQFYHVSADNDFPYNVMGGQQESGSASVASRSNDGAISYRNWQPVGAEEYGYVVADPTDPNIVYGGKISRFDKRTGQSQDISPDPNWRTNRSYRFLRSAPILFAPTDPRTLYFAGNQVFKTTNGGQSWETLSPDLSRDTTELTAPSCVGIFQKEAASQLKQRRGVVYSLAPSPVDGTVIWAGTDDGLIWLTKIGGGTNGGDWKNVTPTSLPQWSKISQLDASHTDAYTCYAAVNSIRLDDYHPHILRTKDGGGSWQEIVNGLPDDPINVVREDPRQPGLLFAGSERMVYYSLNDGENWQPLRLNMPCSSIRDLVIKDDDIVVATHGRSFWILDNITPLRQMAAQRMSAADTKDWPDVLLFPPQQATRVRWSTYPDTPVPGDEPVGQNPPDGAAIDYFIKEDASEVNIDIYTDDEENRHVGHLSSREVKRDLPALLFNQVPDEWQRPSQNLPIKAGLHRVFWDLHELTPSLDPRMLADEYPISAVPGQTAPVPLGPWALPGRYKVHISAKSADGVLEVESWEQLTVRMDPRVQTSEQGLWKQNDLSIQAAQYRGDALEYLEKLTSLRGQIASILPKATGDLAGDLKKAEKEASDLQKRWQKVEASAKGLFDVLQSADVAPSPTTEQLLANLKTEYDQTRIATTELIYLPSEFRLNNQLKEAKLPAVSFLENFSEWKDAPVADDDWKPLFADNLSDATFKPGTWTVKNGELIPGDPDAGIFTKKQYDDFQLDFEFRTEAGANSGLILHCSDVANWIPNSVEVQIADDQSEAQQSEPGNWQCGGIFGHLAPTEHRVFAPGSEDWNHMTVTCLDRKIWVMLNGHLVSEMDMALWTDGRLNPNGTPIPAWMPKPFATLPLRGAIGLQGKHAGKSVWFRYLKIRELK